MNCKPGDLAVIVRGTYAVGRIVTCVRYAGRRTFKQRHRLSEPADSWQIDPPVPGWRGALVNHVRDADMRPIRDNVGEDEILRIAGKPQPVSV
jgi:hypothetical protein